MATVGGAKNLGRQDELGVIAPGFAADFVAWKMTGNLGFTGAGKRTAVISRELRSACD
jgi:cytosine/adenosine deaminase-related metal-dependent hydrolase